MRHMRWLQIRAGYKMQKDLLHVVKLILSMLIVAHWYACLFFLIGNIRHRQVRSQARAESSLLLNPYSNAHGLRAPASPQGLQ